jgi:rhodanese-related sulfurtransferase
MKKFVVVMLVVFIVFSAIGCSSNDVQEETKVIEQKATPQPDYGPGLIESASEYFGEFYDGEKTTTWKNIFAMIDAGDYPFILSIRQKQDYDQGHVVGAYNAAWGNDLAEQVAMFPRETPIYVYSDSGQISGQAVALLSLLQIKAISVESGFDGFTKEADYEAYLNSEAIPVFDSSENYDEETLGFVQAYLKDAADVNDYMIDATELYNGVFNDEFRVFDVREHEQVENASIRVAYINVPFGEMLNKMDFENFSKEERVAVVSKTGQMSGQVTVVMRALGWDAYSLKDGFDAGWSKALFSQSANRFFEDYFAHGINSPWHMIGGQFEMGNSVTVIDLRNEEAYLETHIQSAINAPFGQGLADILDSIPPESDAWVYCDTGQLSAMVAPVLKANNTWVYSLDGGFDGKSRKQYIKSSWLSDEPSELPGGFYDQDKTVITMAMEFLIDAEQNANNMISSEELLLALTEQDITVVDIRKEADFAKAHIENAFSFEYGVDINKRVDVLPEGKLVIVGYDGQYAGYVTTMLRMKGFDAVLLDGGMINGWSGKDYAVVAPE